MSSSTSPIMAPSVPGATIDASRLRVVFASFIGTTIESYDFYVYTTAVALVVGPAFFPHGPAMVQALPAFATFGITFIARLIGSSLLGHFGDRIRRKPTPVASPLVTGTSTTLTGLVPGYDSVGTLAPIPLCVLRSSQDIGLSGERGDAVLLVTEDAPADKHAWSGMFPQLGPSVGFLASNSLLFGLTIALSDEQFCNWGWRVPFLIDAALVALGLYVRLKIAETPTFQAAIDRQECVKVPVAMLLAHHWWLTLLGVLAMVVYYTLFYISTVFSLLYGVGTLHFSRPGSLSLLCLAVVFMGLATSLSAWAPDRSRCKPVLIASIIATILSDFVMAPLLGSGRTSLVALFPIIELLLMGVAFAPMGALLLELFSTNVRYTGADVSYDLGGILGAPIAPYIAQKLAQRDGPSWMGIYMPATAVVSLIGVLCMHETWDARLM